LKINHLHQFLYVVFSLGYQQGYQHGPVKFDDYHKVLRKDFGRFGD
jgi:hypothetical protein